MQQRPTVSELKRRLRRDEFEGVVRWLADEGIVLADADAVERAGIGFGAVIVRVYGESPYVRSKAALADAYEAS